MPVCGEERSATEIALHILRQPSRREVRFEEMLTQAVRVANERESRTCGRIASNVDRLTRIIRRLWRVEQLFESGAESNRSDYHVERFCSAICKNGFRFSQPSERRPNLHESLLERPHKSHIDHRHALRRKRSPLGALPPDERKVEASDPTDEINHGDPKLARRM